MKKSLAYLPENKQRDLRQLTEIIRREIVGCEMIILFGSYAQISTSITTNGRNSACGLTL
ncbi:MAG: hypothetical protein ACLUEV_04960 [Alistipes sp.]